jgi:Arc-like DNA binding domain
MATDKKPVFLRLPDELREKIKAAADARGVPVNREISDRLESSFAEEIKISEDGSPELYSILRVAAAAMELAGPMSAILATMNMDAGKTWIGNSVAYEQAVQAALTVLEAFKPATAAVPHGAAPDTIKTMGREIAVGVLEEAATGLTRTLGPAEIARARKLHATVNSLAGRIAGFDARKSENDPGPMTIRVMHGVPARLTRAAPKKGKRK